jgi:hypothetical protein
MIPMGNYNIYIYIHLINNYLMNIYPIHKICFLCFLEEGLEERKIEKQI